ncbi:hypothetical protein AB0K20_02800 [Micromonospora matsumotoense]|uniref:hypothetical protein n=1 Tax=Micromonospora matsumotoense TaxID=121616 RepID=UPI00341B5783
MVEDQWEALDSEKYEDMCTVLISRMHPDVRRVEGSGRDGGFDVMVPTAAGPMLYEIKRITRRLTPTTRRSIEAALDRASLFEPCNWNLIAPVDPTPASLRWFDAVTAKHPFECSWLGRSWLEAQLAAYPDIRNYYLGDAAKDLAPLLRNLVRQQSAVASGAGISKEGLGDLASRLNQIDPQYSYGLTTESAGGLSVTIWPKYVGAEHDRAPKSNETPHRLKDRSKGPIKGGFETEMFQHAAYLGQAFDASESQIRTDDGASDVEAVRAILKVLNENGRILAQLPLKVESRSAKDDVVTALLRDAAGSISLTVEINLDTRQGKLHLKHKHPADALPGAVIPGLHLINSCRPPNLISLAIDTSETGRPIAITEPFADDLDDFIAIVRAMEDVQQASGVYFTVPKELSDEEVNEIFTAQKLLRGEEVTGRWSTMKITSTAGALPSLKSSLERGPGTLAVDAALTLSIDGQKIPLGMTRRIMPTFVVAEWPELQDDLDPATPVDIVLEPGPDRTATTVLIPDGTGEKGRVRFRPATP